ncbi:hypothetical protein FQN54_004131 [Arachnomyces sp. PD_36]|nr:hypothetical protein FQN54_004131 [Arachnomyces sp. PD_36]
MAASPSTRRRPSTLSLDLSNLPALSHPSPPSNTLLITNLNDLKLFQPASLAEIRSQINAITPLNSFSPLPSFRRIVCSFASIDSAIQIRQILESNNAHSILGINNIKSLQTCRIYFGEHTPVEDASESRKRKLLEAPQSQKLFFISPPPSPPHGWVMRNEEEPNKQVHASDLADALAKLRTAAAPPPPHPPHTDPDTPVSPPFGADGNLEHARQPSWPTNASPSMPLRQRSGSSTIVYDPEQHGSSPHLPAVMVEDTDPILDTPVTMEMDIDTSPTEGEGPRIMAHTPRPPVELME